MSNLQFSSQYTHIPDPVSLEGLDDFLCGLIDELFHVEPATVPEVIEELRQIEQEILNEITDGITEETVDEGADVVSAQPGIFYKSVPTAKTLTGRPSLFEADDSETDMLDLKVKLLESQLDYRNNELKESFRRMKWLESELAAREDQLKFLPELLKRSIDATRYELELDDLKLKLEFLSSDLANANQQLDQIKSNWLGKLSIWLANRQNDRAEQIVVGDPD